MKKYDIMSCTCIVEFALYDMVVCNSVTIYYSCTYVPVFVLTIMSRMLIDEVCPVLNQYNKFIGNTV